MVAWFPQYVGAMFTPEGRERLRAALVSAADADERITGAALTGSAALGAEDRWSDIDLAFGVAAETGQVDADLADRLAGTLRELAR